MLVSFCDIPVQHYEVEVHTGNRWAAETDAAIYVTLFGEQGDTGRRCLYYSHSIENVQDQQFGKFQKK